MANNGTYGIVKPANINVNDVDIFYHYRPTRSTDSANFPDFKQIDSSLLVKQTVGGSELNGMYNLKLPLDLFGETGIYTIYIKPKELSATILDVSTLAAYPNVRGLVIDSTSILTSDTTIFNNGGLVGYRIEYSSNTNNSELYRIITSSNRCEPVAQNLNDPSAKGIKYRFNDASNLIFCTVTPSTGMSFKADSIPYIGQAMESVKLVNTKFNPVCLEIEMTEHDIEDVSTMLENSQIRNLDNSLITTFNNEGDIYHQFEYGHTIDTLSGIHSDWKNKRDNTNIENDEKYRMDEILKSF